LLWLLHFGLDLQQATEAPGFHSEHFPSSFYPRRARPGVLAVEERTGPATVARLRARGHRVEVVDGWSLGRVCAVGRDPRSGFLLAAASPRGRRGTPPGASAVAARHCLSPMACVRSSGRPSLGRKE
jgi:gamma-glutamyltranspeptidase/glutathione hydrolase